MARIEVNLDGGLNEQDDPYKLGFNEFTKLQNVRQISGVLSKRYGTGSQNTITSKTVDNVENFVSRRLAGVEIAAGTSNVTFSASTSTLSVASQTGMEVPGDGLTGNGSFLRVFKAEDAVYIDIDGATSANERMFVIKSVDSATHLTFYSAPTSETISANNVMITFAVNVSGAPTYLTTSDENSYDGKAYLLTYSTGDNKFLAIVNGNNFGDLRGIGTTSSTENIHMRAKSYADAVRFSCGLDTSPRIFRYVNRHHFNGYLKYGNNTFAALLYPRWAVDTAVISNQSSAFSELEAWNRISNSSNFSLKGFRGSLNLVDNIYDYKVIPVFDGTQEMLLDDSVFDFTTRGLHSIGTSDTTGFTSAYTTGIRAKGSITLANLNNRVSGLNVYRSTNSGTFFKVKSIYMGDNDPNIKHILDMNRSANRFYYSAATTLASDTLNSKVLMYDGYETVIVSDTGNNDWKGTGYKTFNTTDALGAVSPTESPNFGADQYGGQRICKFNQVSKETETIRANNGEAIGGSSEGGWYIADGTEWVDNAEILNGNAASDASDHIDEFADGDGEINVVFADSSTPGPFSTAFSTDNSNSSGFHAKFENDGSVQNDSTGHIRLNETTNAFDQTKNYIVSGWIRVEGFDSSLPQWRVYLDTDDDDNPDGNRTGDLVIAEGKGGAISQNIDNWRYFQYELNGPGTDETGGISLYVRILTPANWIATEDAWQTGSAIYLKALSIRERVTNFSIGTDGEKPLGFYGKNILADTTTDTGISSIGVPNNSLGGNYYHLYHNNDLASFLSSAQETALADSLNATITEFDFATGTSTLIGTNMFTGTNCTFANASGRGHLENNTTAQGIVTLPIITVVGETYDVDFDFISSDASNINVSLGASAAYNGSNSVTVSSARNDINLDTPFKATGTTSYLALQLTSSVSGKWVEIDNLRVKYHSLADESIPPPQTESTSGGVILDNTGPFIKLSAEAIPLPDASDRDSKCIISTSNYRFATDSHTSSTVAVDFIDPGWVDGNKHPFSGAKSLDVKHKYATMLNGRQFVANVKIQSEGDTEEYPNFVMYSEPGAPDVIPVTNFIQLQDLQGGEIVGIETLMNDIVVFMTRGIFRISIPSADPTNWNIVEAHPNIGCLHDKAITKAPNGIYFLSESNVYFLNSGFEAIPIGNKIRDVYQEKSTNTSNAAKMRLHYDVKYNRIYLTHTVSTNTIFYIFNINTNQWNTELHTAVLYDEFSLSRENDTLFIETDTHSKIRNAIDTTEFRDVNGAGSQVAIDMTVKTGKQLLTSLDDNALIRRVNTITDDGGGAGELNLELSGVTPTVTKNDHLVGVQSTRASARGKFAQIQISDSTNEDNAKEISKVDVEYE